MLCLKDFLPRLKRLSIGSLGDGGGAIGEAEAELCIFNENDAEELSCT